MKSQTTNKSGVTKLPRNILAGIVTILVLPLLILMPIFPKLRQHLIAFIHFKPQDEDVNEESQILLALLRQVSADSSPDTVDPVLQVYRDRLNADLGEQLYHWSNATFAKVSSTEAVGIAATVVNFSNRVRTFGEGDRTQNLEMARWGYQAALIFYNRENCPLEWAKVQYNLGNIYRDRTLGNPRDNLTHAIAAFENALQVFTPEAYPQEYTLNQRQLMGAYQQKAKFQSLTNSEELNSSS